ncbi:hypothetical protein CcrColossus_gp157 [Caulobacter phage CcrColossus]|uniref:Uncharacterized protein n=1 Tax=Caulobacter phage CcrColossus TaxID=1211640 RepID=K4K687_9CAUD|nr:hypothetical protein CcrColossus_gp157 [Caulobacter phage CcrColossus]AFU88027.1 hypothetical protein CcrColossus_gp157 [Caulobacter phage CcrColossus]
MTPDPTPFITSLKREADGYANMLTITAIVVILAYFGAHTSHVWLHWFAADTVAFLRKSAIVLGLFWLIFYGVAILIDYAVYATIRAWAEFFAYALAPFRAEAKSEEEPVIGVTSNIKIDVADLSAVTYLRDRMNRTDPPKGGR